MSIAIRIDKELEERLNNLCEKTHRSKSFYVREALENYIEELEDYYLAHEVSKNPGRIYTLEEVEKMCDLEDKGKRARGKATAKAR